MCPYAAGDTPDYARAEKLGVDTRGFLKAVIDDDGTCGKELQKTWDALADEGFTWDKQNDKLRGFFTMFQEFILIKCPVRWSDGKGQEIREISIAELYSEMASRHIHAGCSFHLECNFAHCVYSLVHTIIHCLQKWGVVNFADSITAFLHDIGKFGTETRWSFKKGSPDIVAYPNHGVLGSYILHALYGAHFHHIIDPLSWSMMCNVVEFHMYGLNATPHPLKIEALKLLPKPLISRLVMLGPIDKASAVPLNSSGGSQSATCLASSTKDIENIMGSDLSVCGYMTAHGLRGVTFIVMGPSGCGKSTISKSLNDALVDTGIDPDFISHFQRDNFIRQEGRKILGDENADYATAYTAVTKANAEEKKAGKKMAAKARVSDNMKTCIQRTIALGHIAIVDTCATWYWGGRFNILPSNVKNSLRIYVYPLRTTLVTEHDAARHGMDMATQINRAETCISPLTPFESMRGKKGTGMNEVRNLFTSGKPENKINTFAPHFSFVVPGAVREDQRLENLALNHMLSNFAGMKFAPEENTDDMNLLEYMRNQEEMYVSTGVDREVQLDELKDHFNQMAYNFSCPLNRYANRAEYYLAVLNNDPDAKDMRTQLEMASVRLLSPLEIRLLKKKQVTNLVKTGEDLRKRIVTIKYRDGINQLWKGWQKETRNVVCITPGKDLSDWDVVSVMPRGEEVASHKNIEELGGESVTDLQDGDVEDEDMCDSRFSETTNIVIRAINGKDYPKDAVTQFICSSKRDGMCMRIFEIRKGHRLFPFYMRLTRFIDEPLVNMFVKASMAVTGGKALFIPASNGTPFLTHQNVINWMVCSIAISYGISHERLLLAVKDGKDAYDILTEHDLVTRFVTDCMGINFQGHVPETLPHGVITHMFESMGGPNRTCALNREPQRELACSYTSDQCMNTYLGSSFTKDNGDPCWLPHFVTKHNFYEPTFWDFGTCIEKMRKALDSLVGVLTGKITWDEFYAAFQRGNVDVTKTMTPDAEGFVLYAVMKDGRYVYFKAKSWPYYILHKIKSRHIPMILGMNPSIGNHFPAYNEISDFFGPDARQNIKEMVTKMTDFVLTIDMTCTIAGKARGAYESAVEKNDDTKAFKVALFNGHNDVWVPKSVEVISSYFPRLLSLKDDSVEIANRGELRNICGSVTRNMIMEAQTHSSGWEARVDKMLDTQSIASTGIMSKPMKQFWDLLTCVA
jgi:energy-coupling factor transporter ATP-binding protein EcfA2